MLRNLLRAVKGSDLEFMVVSLTTRSPIGDEIAAMGIPVVTLEGAGGVLSPPMIARLFRLAARWNPHLIHGWMYHANLAAFAVSLLPRLHRPALITSVRGALDAPDKQKRLLRFVRRLDAAASRRADAVVFNSVKSAKQHVAAGYDGGRIHVIPNGFDSSRFRPSPQAGAALRGGWGVAQEPLIGVVGRFHPVKGHRGFLEAAALVSRKRPDCKFVLVGKGCEESNKILMGWLSELDLGHRFLLLGERQDVCDIDCALDIAVSSSLSESFPNAIGEAMSCAVPAVVTDVGDCATLVGDAGVVVAPRDAAGLAEGILRLLDMGAEARVELGRRARLRIEQHYSLPVVASRFADLYRSCLAGRCP